MMLPDILLAKPKKTLRQGRADASSDLRMLKLMKGLRRVDQ